MVNENNLLIKKIKIFHELFIGGGSILFGLLSLIENGDITLEEQSAINSKNPSSKTKEVLIYN